MENNELQSLIAELRAQLGDNAISVELIDFEESSEPEASAEPQSDPGPAMPDELVAMLSRAAEEMAKEIFGDGIVTTQVTQLSPADDSKESREAMRSMLRGMGMQSQRCYHYILDSAGQPVHCEDGKEIEAFQRRGAHILANKRFNCQGLKMQVTTGFMVHNAMTSDEPPVPCWATQVIREDTEEVGAQEVTYSAADAMRMHRYVCASTQHIIASVYRQRRPSPTRRAVAQRRIAAGQDVLRRKRGTR